MQKGRHLPIRITKRVKAHGAKKRVEVGFRSLSRLSESYIRLEKLGRHEVN
jgi:hypothetical protein